MFSSKSVQLLKKRDGILGQFQKALDGLRTVNDAIDGAVAESDMKLEMLDDQIAKEMLEKQELQRQKDANNKTIQKMQEFLV